MDAAATKIITLTCDEWDFIVKSFDDSKQGITAKHIIEDALADYRTSEKSEEEE